MPRPLSLLDHEGTTAKGILPLSEPTADGAPALPVKVTLKQVVTNEFVYPYGYREFQEMLEKEHCDENLVFLNDVLCYQKKAIASGLYPEGENQKGALLQRSDSEKRAKGLVVVEAAASLDPSAAVSPVGRFSFARSPSTLANSMSAGDLEVPETRASVLAAEVPVGRPSLLSRLSTILTPSSQNGSNASLNSPAVPTASANVLNNSTTPGIARANTATRPRAFSELKGESHRDIVKTILDTFVREGSPREVNLSERARKQIISEFENKNYNPEIFRTAVDHVAGFLRQGAWMRFVAWAANEPGSGNPTPRASSSPRQRAPSTSSLRR